MSAPSLRSYGLHIAGEEVPSSRGETQTLLDPASNEPLARTALGGRDDAKHAVEVAWKAYREGPWSAPDGSHRGKVLYRLSQLLSERVDEFARLETSNQGKPLRESKGDVVFAARTLEYYAGLADKLEGHSIPVPGERLDYSVREPVGVTVHIAPWNYPLQLSVRSLAPALAAGNTAVLKPATVTPLSALALAKLAQEAGMPAGVLNVVVGSGREVGETLATDPRVATISFTGSTSVGQRLLELAARNVTPVTLELGGKGPNIVLPDADLDRAAKGVAFGIFMNAGQMCWAGSRLLVHASIADAFLDKLAAQARALRLGPGLEPGVEMGPLVTQDHRATVESYIEAGRTEGARLVTGGARPASPALAKGNFLEPTIFADAKPGMRIAREEIFGPVLTSLTFGDLDEALALANDSPYGLFAGIWTRDLSTAHRAARQLQCGMVSVNEYPVTFPQTPFGGYKQSGIGSEQGSRAWEFYTRLKNVNIFFGAPRPKK